MYITSKTKNKSPMKRPYVCLALLDLQLTLNNSQVKLYKLNQMKKLKLYLKKLLKPQM